MLRHEIKKILNIPDAEIEQPENKRLGDYSTNVALKLAKKEDRKPMGIAQEIKLQAEKEDTGFFEKVEVAPPGFVNFFLSKEYLQKQVGVILKQKEKFGNLKIGNRQKVNVEFISANPTGPLHIGNGRGGFCGDVLANVLGKAGYKAFREYYVNDMGRQILFLENSLSGREPSYKNQYIDELKAKGEKNVKKAVEYIVERIKETTERMGIGFDNWFFESDLYKKKETDKVLDFLKKNDLTYEKEEALWFKSAKFGDDKNRVLIKSDDKETYFLSDIAYMKKKFNRGFNYLIIFLGAEHYGYIGRLKAAAKALGYNPERVMPIIMQLVKIMEEGKGVRMSKRGGIFVTLDELLDEVGKDVVRFFFLTRSSGSHLLFDLGLAKEQ